MEDAPDVKRLPTVVIVVIVAVIASIIFFFWARHSSSKSRLLVPAKPWQQSGVFYHSVVESK